MCRSDILDYNCRKQELKVGLINNNNNNNNNYNDDDNDNNNSKNSNRYYNKILDFNCLFDT